ncbi:sodium/potassium/calcium exchanger 4-like isoform X1 [Mytilus trossulus]|uniref:sodium/potassium/calcium exchanger 4-like isoform X1 n=1 Tax=Mytilus trossulus TaxID=6551 RepID=UPI003005BD64
MANSTGDSYQTKISEHIRTSTIMSMESTIRPLESTIIYVLNNITNDSTMPNITILKPTPICTEPAFHEFPPDAFTNTQREHGALIVHVMVVIYMFAALAVVCDDYFVTSLDRICQKLGFSEDVAGATFMAAGSSAPELFTAIIGVFITKGDVGVGTIVGSAVFNILFVIGICGILAGQVVTLSWWMMCRDSFYYSLSVVVLILVSQFKVVSDGIVTWYESLIMLILYAGYIVVMRYNTFLQSWFANKIDQIKSSNILPINGAKRAFPGDYEVFTDEDDEVFTAIETKKWRDRELPPDEYAKSTQIKPHFCDFVFRMMMMKKFKSLTRFRSAACLIISYRKRMLKDEAYLKRQQFRKMAHKSSVMSYTRSIRGWFNITMEGEDWDYWRKVPSLDDGYIVMTKWALSYPLKTVLYYTVPDCRKERWENWFLLTFVMSIVWIALFSYIMVWMVTVVGFTLDIPDSVMGITFLAAGTSIPDAMASVFVVKQGMGDMAISNCLGSNIFDILLGLSLPWFLKTGIAYSGTTVKINSNGMLYSIILLFITVIITIGAISYSGWRLTRRIGIMFLVSYAIYVLFSVMTECNVFGFVNPPMCGE